MKPTTILSATLVCFLIIFNSVESKSLGEMNKSDINNSGTYSRSRRAFTIAEIEVGNRRQQQIRNLLRQLYLVERMRQLSATKRTEQPHLDYNLDGEMSYTNMKRDLSNQEDDFETIPANVVQAFLQLVDQSPSQAHSEEKYSD